MNEHGIHAEESDGMPRASDLPASIHMIGLAKDNRLLFCQDTCQFCQFSRPLNGNADTFLSLSAFGTNSDMKEASIKHKF
jgi:hypothetical protein